MLQSISLEWKQAIKLFKLGQHLELFCFHIYHCVVEKDHNSHEMIWLWVIFLLKVFFFDNLIVHFIENAILLEQRAQLKQYNVERASSSHYAVIRGCIVCNFLLCVNLIGKLQSEPSFRRVHVIRVFILLNINISIAEAFFEAGIHVHWLFKNFAFSFGLIFLLFFLILIFVVIFE